METYGSNEQLLERWKVKHEEKGCINFIKDGIIDKDKDKEKSQIGHTIQIIL